MSDIPTVRGDSASLVVKRRFGKVLSLVAIATGSCLLFLQTPLGLGSCVFLSAIAGVFLVWESRRTGSPNRSQLAGMWQWIFVVWLLYSLLELYWGPRPSFSIRALVLLGLVSFKALEIPRTSGIRYVVSLGASLILIALCSWMMFAKWVPLRASLPAMEACATLEDEAFNPMWREWAATSDWVQRRGGAVNVQHVRQASAGIELDSIPLDIGQRMGVLTKAELEERLGDAAMWRKSLADASNAERPLSGLDLQDGVLATLLLLGKLEDSDRDVLLGRLESTLRQAAEGGEVLKTFRAIELLEKLDQDSTAEDVAQAAKKSLENFGKRRAKSEATQLLSSPSLFEMGAAVELMARYGVPVTLDLERMRSELEERGKPHELFAQRDWVQMHAAVTLDKMEVLLEGHIRPRGWMEGHHLMIGGLWLILLGWGTVLMAKPSEVEHGS